MKKYNQSETVTAKQFPETVRCRSSIATIYSVHNRTKTRFEVRYHDTDGLRKRQTFDAYDDAKSHAQSVVEELARGGADMIVLRGKDRYAYEEAIVAVRSLGVELDAAIKTYAESVKTLDGAGTLHEAVAYYRKHRPNNLSTVPLKTVVDEFIQCRTNDEASKLYLRDLRVRLGRLARMFNMPISDLTPQDIEVFLDSIGKSRRTRYNYRGNVQTLFNFAKERGYLPPDFPDLFKISKKKCKFARVVQVFTPDEIQKLLNNAKPAVAVCLAITAFSGIRAEEVKRLQIKHVNLSKNHIEVPAALAKNGTRRLTPITPNLKAWLERCLPKQGPVCTYVNLSNQYLKLARETDLKWKKNALRHSFVSYRVAAIGNEPQVAMESGHTLKELQTDYLHVVDRDAATTWFNVSPQDKVIHVPVEAPAPPANISAQAANAA